MQPVKESIAQDKPTKTMPKQWVCVRGYLDKKKILLGF